MNSERLISTSRGKLSNVSLNFQRYLLSRDESQRIGSQSQLFRHSNGVSERYRCVHRYFHAVYRRRAGASADLQPMASRLLDRTGLLRRYESDLRHIREWRSSGMERSGIR